MAAGTLTSPLTRPPTPRIAQHVPIVCATPPRRATARGFLQVVGIQIKLLKPTSRTTNIPTRNCPHGTRNFRFAIKTITFAGARRTRPKEAAKYRVLTGANLPVAEFTV